MNKIRYFGLLMVALLISISGAVAQNVILTGQVTEDYNGLKEPILGANVAVVNKSNRVLGGGVTDMDGNYSIAVPANEKNLKIRFSYISLRANYKHEPRKEESLLHRARIAVLNFSSARCKTITDI